MDRIYCAEQIEVPPELPGLLKAYTKEVIRYNPTDLVAFSAEYFEAHVNGELQAFLDKWEQRKLSAGKK